MAPFWRSAPETARSSWGTWRPARPSPPWKGTRKPSAIYPSRPMARYWPPSSSGWPRPTLERGHRCAGRHGWGCPRDSGSAPWPWLPTPRFWPWCPTMMTGSGCGMWYPGRQPRSCPAPGARPQRISRSLRTARSWQARRPLTTRFRCGTCSPKRKTRRSVQAGFNPWPSPPTATCWPRGVEDGTVTLWDVTEWTGPRPRGLVKISGDNQQGAPGAELADPYIVEVRDQNGDPLPGVRVVFRVISGGG